MRSRCQERTRPLIHGSIGAHGEVATHIPGGSVQGHYIHRDSIIQFCDPAAASIFGYDSPDQLVGGDHHALAAPRERARLDTFDAAGLRDRVAPCHATWEALRRDGTTFWVEGVVSLVPWRGDLGVLVTMVDLTAREYAEAALRESEAHLRQALKVETLGRLASGVAHDFNNLLTVIGGRAQLLRARLRPDDPARREVDVIEKTADRAAALTKQLLVYTRRKVSQQKLVDLNLIVAEMAVMLQRVIGEQIELQTHQSPRLGRVRADQQGLEQIILNLVINARDAMPLGGTLTLETANVELDEVFAARHRGARPGPYILLSVTDSGVGMDEPTQSRVFEPFFTTKEEGKGTGLGLSIVYAIVKQHGGYVAVDTAPGQGATFKIYLPRADQAGEPGTGAGAARSALGAETILLVEGAPEAREAVRRALDARGYRVLEAPGPDEALLIAERYPGPIHLLVADTATPMVQGMELAERVRTLRPDIKTLYLSGAPPALTEDLGVADDTHLLGKPVEPEALLRSVREALDPSPSGSGTCA